MSGKKEKIRILFKGADEHSAMSLSVKLDSYLEFEKTPNGTLVQLEGDVNQVKSLLAQHYNSFKEGVPEQGFDHSLVVEKSDKTGHMINSPIPVPNSN